MRAFRMLLVLMALAAVAVGVTLYLRIQEGRARVGYQPAEQRRAVLGLRFETRHEEKTLEDFRGKVVLVDVWAGWCGPCLREVPKLIQLQARYAPELAVIALNVDQEGWPAVKRFREAFPDVNYLIVRPTPEPLIVNTIVDLSPLGQVSVLPTSFLLDRQGRVVAKYVGIEESEQIPEDVQRLLQESD